MDRRAWRATVHGGHKELDVPENTERTHKITRTVEVDAFATRKRKNILMERMPTYDSNLNISGNW